MLLPAVTVIVAVLVAAGAVYTVRVVRRATAAAAAAQARSWLTERVLDRDIGALSDQLAEARASSPSLSPEEGGSDV